MDTPQPLSDTKKNLILSVHPHPLADRIANMMDSETIDDNNVIMEATAAKEEDKEEEEDDNTDDEILCPLFMQGLPRNFESNPQLAAIASLLEESEEDDDKKPKSIDNNQQRALPAPCQGGGKAKRSHHTNRTSRSHKPYSNPKESKRKKAATVGEAQLFLNMWKL